MVKAQLKTYGHRFAVLKGGPDSCMFRRYLKNRLSWKANLDGIENGSSKAVSTVYYCPVFCQTGIVEF